MKHPQSFAITCNKAFSTSEIKAIAEYGCCAFVLMWCLGINVPDFIAVKKVQDMIRKKVIDTDCTVKWSSAVDHLTERQLADVKFVEISGIKDIKERTPVMYKLGEKCHWVGVENGKVAFNPLKFSQCVTLGKPAEKRVLIFKE